MATIDPNIGGAATTKAPVPTAATNTANAVSSASKALAGNFDTFLQLLTTQLKHQDPSAPLDTNQFTAQLVQFAGVEQQINMNTSMQSLIKLQQDQQATAQQTAQVTQALQYMGQNVNVNGDTATLNNGQIKWLFSVPQ
ncbi:MAG TPA: flagellar hook capping FlgD N-terminal domain-containing protein, partial [Xanthobacteraceae bacterium]|nr:flagellar hook capping FlgD N-terminal domain-containing protein [Xanthobacteraceae bacterium]